MAMAVIIVANVAIATQGISGWVVSPPLPASISSVDVVVISYCVAEGVAEGKPAKEKRQRSSLSVKVYMMSKQNA